MKKPSDSCSGGSRVERNFREMVCWVCDKPGAARCPFAGPFSSTPESWREQYRAARAKMLGRE